MRSLYGRTGLMLALGSLCARRTSRAAPAVRRAAWEALEPRRLLAEFVVIHPFDAGAGSLRAAITSANAASGADTITFAAGMTETINLASALPTLSDSVNITGPAAGVAVRRDFGGAYGIFTVIPGITVSLSNLTISNGSAPSGGGIRNSGTLTLTNCTVSGNSSTFNIGGGIYNAFGGTLTLVNSTVSGNTAATEGGGIANDDFASTLTLVNSTVSGNAAATDGGGIYNNAGGTVTLTNSTVSGNTAATDGGGIHNNSGGTVALTNSTVTNNRADADGSSFGIGGGIFGFNGTVTASNSIIARNFFGTGMAASDVTGSLAASSAHNLIGTGGSGGLTNGNGNIIGVADPMLGPLAGNGGPTLTHALLDGSLAFNMGSNSLVPAGVTTDQRGLGFPRTIGGIVDIGAFEYGGVQSLLVTTLADENDGTSDPFFGTGTSLREAIAWANAKPGADTITFSAAASGTINLGGVLPSLSDSVTIAAPAAGVTVRRNTGGAYRIFEVNAGLTVILSNLTISNGSAPSGGGIRNSGTLTLTNSTVSGNTAAIEGGGIYNNTGGTVTLTNSTVSGNSANSGGGIYNAGAVTLANCTVAGNSSTVSFGGGIHNAGTLTLTSSTIAGNSAGSLGGGIHNTLAVTLTNSTVSGNSANVSGGGIYDIGTMATLTGSTVTNNRADADNNNSGDGGGIFHSAGTVTANNTIIARNFVGGTGTTASDISGTLAASSAHNLIGIGGSGGLVSGVNGNLVGVADPKLGPLANNGGPTLTHALQAGSPAINAGSNVLTPAGVTTDQRGPGFPRTIGSVVDIGAVEYAGVQSLLVTTLLDENNGHSDPSFGTGTSLREAIAWANANPGADTITFNLAGAGPYTVNLTGALPSLFNVTITGPAAGLTVRRNSSGNYRIFDIPDNATASLSNLTISNGSEVGGGIYNIGTLTLTNCTVSGNSAPLNVGGGIFNLGTLTLTHCTVSGNSAADEGGGIYNNLESVLTLINSTVSDNSAGPHGGGIRNRGTLTLTNSTVSGNSAGALGGGIANSGTLTLNNSTVTNNRADADGNGTGVGGGVSHSGPAPTVRNTIIARNFIGTGTTASDISGTLSASSAYNLIGTGGSGGLVNGVNGNLVGITDPKLAPLADNGGPTLTHALLAGSPATGAGSNALVPAGVTTDQRGTGFPRIVAGTVDIGSYEASVVEVPPQVQAASFQFETRHDVRIEFDREVTIPTGVSALQVLNLTTGQNVPSAGFTLQLANTAGGATVATWIAASPLPDGNYRAALPGTSVLGGGLPMASNFTLDFFVLSGDADRDRSVNIADFSILASRFNLPGTFGQGDFNYNGAVEIGDFSILASRFNTSLPPFSARPGAGGGEVLPAAKLSEPARIKAGRFFDELLA